MMWIDVLGIVLDVAILGLILAAGWQLRSRFSGLMDTQKTAFLIRSDLEDLLDQVQLLTALPSPDTNDPTEQHSNAQELDPHRLRVEIEILSELWDALLRLQRSTIDLQSIDKRVEPSTQPDGMEAQIRTFAESYHALSDLLHRKRPFYSQDIFDALVRIMAISEGESKPPSGEISPEDQAEQGILYWDEAINRSERIVDGIDRVCELIRKRIYG